MEADSPLLTKAADGIWEVGAFGDPQQLRFDWERSYTRRWLDHVPTCGGHTEFPPATLEEHRERDRGGGRQLTMRYAAVVLTAERTPAA